MAQHKEKPTSNYSESLAVTPADPKIVPFGSVSQTNKRVHQGKMKSRVVAECRSVYSKYLTNIHHDFFDKVDDELFSLSDKAENSSLQAAYFEAMRFVRREREGIQQKYVNNALTQYDDFWNRKANKKRPQKIIAELDEDSFSLVENEALEEDLAISTMIDKGNKLFHSELYGLHQRFSFLVGGSNFDEDDNPVTPYQLCHGFEGVIKPLMLELNIKLVIYKLYDRIVIFVEISGIARLIKRDRRKLSQN